MAASDPLENSRRVLARHAAGDCLCPESVADREDAGIWAPTRRAACGRAFSGHRGMEIGG
jgi:hypothetical protein